MSYHSLAILEFFTVAGPQILVWFELPLCVPQNTNIETMSQKRTKRKISCSQLLDRHSVHACYLSTWEAEAGEWSQVESNVGYMVSLKF